jgi:hypothetical protein
MNDVYFECSDEDISKGIGVSKRIGCFEVTENISLSEWGTSRLSRVPPPLSTRGVGSYVRTRD